MSSFLKKQTLLSEDKTIPGQKELTFDRSQSFVIKNLGDISVGRVLTQKKAGPGKTKKSFTLRLLSEIDSQTF